LIIDREQRERAEQRAREEAEKVRRDKELVTQKKEEERLARKKVADIFLVFSVSIFDFFMIKLNDGT